MEDPKYVGDASFMADMPDKYRVDPESKELSRTFQVRDESGARLQRCATFAITTQA